MWDRSLWEQENQEKLREAFYNQTEYGGKYEYKEPIRRIICEGCGKVFYTQVKVKMYCNDECAKRGYWKHQRQRRLEQRRDMVCKGCGKTFTPKRSDAVYCSNACRQRAYRRSVTAKAKWSE